MCDKRCHVRQEMSCKTRDRRRETEEVRKEAGDIRQT